MATVNDHKNAQKVIAANELAREISDLDPERFAAALTLLTPSEIDRLGAIAHVAAMLVLATATAAVEPRPRKKRAAKDPSPGPAAGAAPPATEAAGPGKDVAHVPLPPRCEAPECGHEGVAAFVFLDGNIGRFCDTHVAVRPDSILREWHEAWLRALNVTPRPEGRKRAQAIRQGIEGEPGKVA